MYFIPLIKESSNYSKCSAFACSALLHLSFNSNSVSFVEGGRKNISCLRAQGTLVTPLGNIQFGVGNSSAPLPFWLRL